MMLDRYRDDTYLQLFTDSKNDAHQHLIFSFRRNEISFDEESIARARVYVCVAIFYNILNGI